MDKIWSRYKGTIWFVVNSIGEVYGYGSSCAPLREVWNGLGSQVDEGGVVEDAVVSKQ
jgi:hypothetical protein